MSGFCTIIFLSITDNGKATISENSDVHSKKISEQKRKQNEVHIIALLKKMNIKRIEFI